MSKCIVEVELHIKDLPDLEKAIAAEVKKAVDKSTADIIKLLEGKAEGHEDTEQHDGAGNACCHKSCSKEVR